MPFCVLLRFARLALQLQVAKESLTLSPYMANTKNDLVVNIQHRPRHVSSSEQEKWRLIPTYDEILPTCWAGEYRSPLSGLIIQFLALCTFHNCRSLVNLELFSATDPGFFSVSVLVHCIFLNSLGSTMNSLSIFLVGHPYIFVKYLFGSIWGAICCQYAELGHIKPSG